MPPRYAYWTIIVDNQPTAFRSGSQEELMPTFNRLKAKNDTVVMMWFQIGKLWPSRIAAQEFMRGRSEMGGRRDERPKTGSGFRDRDRKPSSERDGAKRPEWRATPLKSEAEGQGPRRSAKREGGLDWKPKGEFVPAPKRAERAEWTPRDEKPAWKPKSSERPNWKSKPSSPQAFKPSRESFDRGPKAEWKPKSHKSEAEGRGPRRSAEREGGLEWKPKGSFTPAPRRSEGSDWKPKSHKSEAEGRGPRRSAEREGGPEWKPKGSFDRAPSRSERPEWKPKGVKPSSPQAFKPSSPEKRKWVPKEEYKRSMGIEAKRDSKWRPGGEHKDPRQKYKDAKKAKWTKFKKNIRARSGGKGKKSS